jgi:hypothetical protein
MPDARARTLNTVEHIIAEQGVMNLCLVEGVTIFRDGVDITPGLLAQSDRVNSEFDALRAPRNFQPFSPAAMPTKKADPPKVRPPRARRTSR